MGEPQRVPPSGDRLAFDPLEDVRGRLERIEDHLEDLIYRAPSMEPIVDTAAEDAVLAACLDGAAKPSLIVCELADFSDWSRQSAWAAIVASENTDQWPPDLVTIAAVLRRRGNRDADVAEMLVDLSDRVPFRGDVEALAERVATLGALRRACGVCHRLIAAAHTESLTPDQRTVMLRLAELAE